MTLTKTIVVAIAVAVAAASLAGCATAPPPLSVEESLGFDKATGPDITGVPPGLRMQPLGPVYPAEAPFLPPPRY